MGKATGRTNARPMASFAYPPQRHPTKLLAGLSAPGLPDQDQAERRQRRAVSGPLKLVDHEARLRPVDHAGALADPQQAHRQREQADNQKQSAHGVSLSILAVGRPSLDILLDILGL